MGFGVLCNGNLWQGHDSRALEHPHQGRIIQRLQYVDGGTRQQGVIQFEGRVFGGCANEGDQARFHMRQECVLLAFVEAMHLIDKQDGAALQIIAVDGRALDGFANFLDPRQHCRQRNKIGFECRCHQTRNGGFADPWRPPQDHRMRLAAIKGNAQRHAFSSEVILPDDVGEDARTQTLGERRAILCAVDGGWQGFKQVVHCLILRDPAHLLTAQAGKSPESPNCAGMLSGLLLGAKQLGYARFCRACVHCQFQPETCAMPSLPAHSVHPRYNARLCTISVPCCRVASTVPRPA